MQILTFGAALAFSPAVLGRIAFRSEALQLTSADIGDFDDIAFGNTEDVASLWLDNECRYFPGDRGWPSDSEWSRLNASIDGALLKPEPAAAACYPGPGYDEERCRFLVERAASERCKWKRLRHQSPIQGWWGVRSSMLEQSLITPSESSSCQSCLASWTMVPLVQTASEGVVTSTLVQTSQTAKG